jgi:hypothetical protein
MLASMPVPASDRGDTAGAVSEPRGPQVISWLLVAAGAGRVGVALWLSRTRLDL